MGPAAVGDGEAAAANGTPGGVTLLHRNHAIVA
jgi:hypothetical protein